MVYVKRHQPQEHFYAEQYYRATDIENLEKKRPTTSPPKNVLLCHLLKKRSTFKEILLTPHDPHPKGGVVGFRLNLGKSFP
jgi:hypothetical protein